jgi:hypothetical protein
MVVQVPGLVGVGVSGASAAAHTPSYTATLSSIDGNCVATVTATWSDVKLQSVQFQVNDLTTGASTSWQTSVSGKAGTPSHSFQLNPLPASPVTQHSFNAVVDFYSGGNGLAKQIYTNSLDAPCYLGRVV